MLCEQRMSETLETSWKKTLRGLPVIHDYMMTSPCALRGTPWPGYPRAQFMCPRSETTSSFPVLKTHLPSKYPFLFKKRDHLQKWQRLATAHQLKRVKIGSLNRLTLPPSNNELQFSFSFPLTTSRRCIDKIPLNSSQSHVSF